jgi:hypothetical protein
VAELCIVLILLVVFAMCFSAMGLMDLVEALGGPTVSPRPPRLVTFLVIALFGAIGAAFSAIMGLVNSKVETRIPEHVMTAWLTLTRPFIGAVSALIVVFAIMGGVLPALITEPKKLAYILLVTAFAAGFSERLVVRAMTAATKSNE